MNKLATEMKKMHRIILNSNGEIVGKVRLNKCYLSRHQNSSFEFHHFGDCQFLIFFDIYTLFNSGLKFIFAKYTRAAFAPNIAKIANKSIIQ